MKAAAAVNSTKQQQSLQSILTLKTLANRVQYNGEFFVFSVFTVRWISTLKRTVGDSKKEENDWIGAERKAYC